MNSIIPHFSLHPTAPLSSLSSSFTLPPLLTLHSAPKTKQNKRSNLSSHALRSPPQSSPPASSLHSQRTAMSKKSAAVDAIIAEAMDMCALEQIARLNTAHLSSSSSSDLPADLESRFRKLKSLPARPAPAVSGPTLTAAKSLSFVGKENSAPARVPPPAGVTGSDEKVTEEGFVVVSPGDDSEKKMFGEAEKGVRSGSGVRAGEEVKLKKSSSSPDYGFGFSPIKRSSPSPPQSAADRLGCCLFLSPKRKSNNNNTPKSKGRRDPFEEEEQDELGDAREFYAAIKEQQRKLKKTLKEQDRVSREAAKLVRKSKEASARMRANTDELFSDEEEDEDELSTHFH